MKLSSKHRMLFITCTNLQTNAHQTSSITFVHESTTAAAHMDRTTKSKSSSVGSSTRSVNKARANGPIILISISNRSSVSNGLHYAIYQDSNNNTSNKNQIYLSGCSKSTHTTPSSSVRSETAVVSIHDDEHHSPPPRLVNEIRTQIVMARHLPINTHLLQIQAKSPLTLISVRIPKYAKVSDMLPINDQKYPMLCRRQYSKSVTATISETSMSYPYSP